MRKTEIHSGPGRLVPRLAGWCLLLSLSGCSLLFQAEHAQNPPVFYKTDFHPFDPADDLADGDSLQQSLDIVEAYFATRDPQAAFNLGDQICDAETLRETAALLREALAEHGLSEDFFDTVQRDCDAYVPVAPSVQVTAYCTPMLHGSYVATTRYAYPLYRVPDDLVTGASAGRGRNKIGRLDSNNRLVPYYTRDEIDFQGALKDKNCELLWVDNPADAYFLHIEGSGVIQMESGGCIRVGYAGANGHPCRMIGHYLRVEKKLGRSQLTIPGIRDYLGSHPDALREVLASDPSYVFFEISDTGQTVGCYGLPLIPFRAIAADRRYFPPGIPLYLEMTIPVFDDDGGNGPLRMTGTRKFRTLVFNCDTGGVIRGPARIDWYAGSGPLAEAIAGHLNVKARLCLLLRKKPKSANPPVSG